MTDEEVRAMVEAAAANLSAMTGAEVQAMVEAAEANLLAVWGEELGRQVLAGIDADITAHRLRMEEQQAAWAAELHAAARDGWQRGWGPDEPDPPEHPGHP